MWSRFFYEVVLSSSRCSLALAPHVETRLNSGPGTGTRVPVHLKLPHHKFIPLSFFLMTGNDDTQRLSYAYVYN